jgi:peroxiredoxin Q/BCP
LGVNPSNQSRHEQFAAKHSFPFPLLIDKGRKIAAAYGCVMALGLMVRRAVFVIDKEGRIAAYWQGNPAPVEVVEALRRLET